MLHTGSLYSRNRKLHICEIQYGITSFVSWNLYKTTSVLRASGLHKTYLEEEQIIHFLFPTIYILKPTLFFSRSDTGHQNWLPYNTYSNIGHTFLQNLRHSTFKVINTFREGLIALSPMCAIGLSKLVILSQDTRIMCRIQILPSFNIVIEGQLVHMSLRSSKMGLSIHELRTLIYVPI